MEKLIPDTVCPSPYACTYPDCECPLSFTPADQELAELEVARKSDEEIALARAYELYHRGWHT